MRSGACPLPTSTKPSSAADSWAGSLVSGSVMSIGRVRRCRGQRDDRVALAGVDVVLGQGELAAHLAPAAVIRLRTPLRMVELAPGMLTSSTLRPLRRPATSCEP